MSHMHHSMPRSLARSLIAGLALGVVALSAVGATPAPTFTDTLAQRLQACTHCHGEQGRAAPDGYYPRLAGKPAGYLYNQLKHFQSGARWYTLMTQMVAPLSDAYLWEIARHFAAMDVPYPPPLPSTLPPAMLRQGEQLVRHGDSARQIPACVACHGASLTGASPATPGLLGLPPDYINAQLGAWQTGSRRAAAPDCMAHIAQRMTPADIASVSAWLASQPGPSHATVPPSPVSKPPLDCGSHAPLKEQP